MTIGHDDKRAFEVDTFTCHAGKALERVRRTAFEKADDSGRPDGWQDGLHWFVQPYDDQEA